MGANLLNQIVEGVNIIDLLEFLVKFLDGAYRGRFEEISFLLNKELQVVADLLHLKRT